jgi:tRNA-binding EMAP/Myf-like protein
LILAGGRTWKCRDSSAVPKSKKLLKFVLYDGTGTDRIILSGIHAYYEPEKLVGKTLIAFTSLSPRKSNFSKTSRHFFQNQSERECLF